MISIRISNILKPLSAARLHSNLGEAMLKWYDYIITGMFAWVISQGLIYNPLWAFIAWLIFVQYMYKRRDGHV